LLGEYETAISDFNYVIGADSMNTIAYSLRGESNMILKKYTEAINDFTKIIRIFPHDGKAFFNRGMSYLKLKKKKQGCTDLTKSGELGYVEANIELTKNCKNPKIIKKKK
jgi:tetratricopeptide (TPR) repeat protein